MTKDSVLHCSRKYKTEILTSFIIKGHPIVPITELIRWDNAPHFPQLTSFPHYRQGTEVVTDGFDITLAEVLTYISQQLNSTTP